MEGYQVPSTFNFLNAETIQGGRTVSNEERIQKRTEKKLLKRARDEKILEKEEERKIRKAKKRRRHRHIRRVLLVMAALFAVAFAFVSVMVYPEYKKLCHSMYDDLAKINEGTFMRAGNTVIYDKDGKLIGKIGNEKYQYTQLSDISKYVTDGYVAQEDKNFYTHPGVDFVATARAGIALIKHKGEITQGGSTITQQVIKNNLLTQEQTYRRKILEIMLAFKIERRYDKAQIMEFYCNTNYYGNGCYGVEGASRYYFGKESKDLTLAEAAILVGTSNSPNNYNPVASYEKAMTKKKQVLDSMLRLGYITEDEYEKAVKEEPVIVKKTDNVKAESYQISYALHCAALKVMKQEGFEFRYVFPETQEYTTYKKMFDETYENTYERVRTGGYTIKTSLDSGIQKTLQKSLDKGLKGFTKKVNGVYELQGAAVCIDNETQMVAAIVGGRGTKSSFNRGYQAKRQPGSSIKPLLDYGPALNEGVVIPSTVMTDQKVTYNGYTPQNAGGSYLGKITVRDALARSKNTIAVQLFDKTGQDRCMDYLGKLHFSSLTPVDSDVLAVAIGGFTDGVTVADMARGYATIANGGNFSENTCIVSLTDYTGKTIYKSSDRTTEVYDADAAFMLTDMMQGVFNLPYGTAHRAKTDKQCYAGKTGTTNDSRDAWFSGFSKYYTTTVWVGCDNPKPVSGLQGASYPLTIWKDFMDQVHEGKKKQEFLPPESIRLVSSRTSGLNPYPHMLETMNVTYNRNIYSSRPAGWDYISGNLLGKIEKIEEDKKQKLMEQRVTAEVTEFEKNRISSPEDALNLKETYNRLLQDISGLENENVKQKLLERAAYKYDLLSGDVVNTWGSFEVAKEEYEQAVREEQETIASQEDLEKANVAYESEMSAIVNWYITELNKRTTYTDNVQKLIDDGSMYLEQCRDMSVYSQLFAKFDMAKARALALPRKDYSKETAEKPDYDGYEDSERDTEND